MRALLPIVCVVSAALGIFIGSQPSDATPKIAAHPQQLSENRKPPTPNPSPAPTPASTASHHLPAARFKDPENPSLADLDSLAKQPDLTQADHRLTIMAAINYLSSAQLSKMLAQEMDNAVFLRSERFDFKYATARLCEIAPEKAAELWTQNPGARSFTGGLIEPWAKRDPIAFANWTLTQPPDAQRAARQALAESASSDPTTFASVAHQLGTTPNAGESARAAMRAFAEKDPDPAKSLAYAARLPEGIMRDNALAELVRSGKVDPKNHPDVQAALVRIPDRDAFRIGSELAKTAESLPQGAIRDAAMQAALRDLSRKDAGAAAKRLESLPANSPDYAAAVRGFVDVAAAKDPASAAEWAVSIPPTNSSHRSGALERVAKEYFQTNPDGAREWVEKAPLSDEEYRRLTGRARSAPKQ